MRTVRDDAGDTYLLVKRSAESSLIRDPATGAERYVDNAGLTVVDDASALATAAAGVPEPVRRVLRAVHGDESLGLLAVIVDAGPISAIDLLETVDACESDLHGGLSEFRAAGLVEEAEVAGRRGYAATDVAIEGLALLRGIDDDRDVDRDAAAADGPNSASDA